MALTLEQRDKNGRLTRGHEVPSEWREKFRIMYKGKHSSPKTEFKKGIIPWNKGKETFYLRGNNNPMKNPEIRKKVAEKNKISIKNLYRKHPEIKEKIKKATIEAMKRPEVRVKTQKTWFKKGLRASPKTEFKKGLIPWNKGREHPFVKGDKNPMKCPEVRKKVSDKNKIVIKNLYKEHPEIIQKIKEKTKEAMKRPDINQKIKRTWFKKGNIPWTKGKPRPIKTKRKIRNTLRELYKNNPEYLKKILTFRRPNKSEEILDSWIQSYFPKEFVFVGNGSFIIEGSNPDWVGCGGKRQIIELFGEPWHNPEEEQLRKNRFAKLGYHTLVIWYEELKDKKSVLGKIRNFIEAS